MNVADTDALNIALNKSECLVSKTYLGYDKITNVCTGKTFDVAWGVGDWVGAVALTALSLIVVALLWYLVRLLREDF